MSIDAELYGDHNEFVSCESREHDQRNPLAYIRWYLCIPEELFLQAKKYQYMYQTSGQGCACEEHRGDEYQESSDIDELIVL